MSQLLIRDYWEHPMGTGVSIINSKGEELTSHVSNHILSSDLFTQEDLKDYEIELRPSEEKEYSADLLKIPILKQTESSPKHYLPKGEYKIQAYYYSINSNVIEFEII